MRIEKSECNYQVTECDLKFGEQITLDGELLVPVSVLDKIRAEIEQLHHHPILDFINTDKVVDMALEIIDKYRAEQGVSNADSD